MSSTTGVTSNPDTHVSFTLDNSATNCRTSEGDSTKQLTNEQEFYANAWAHHSEQGLSSFLNSAGSIVDDDCDTADDRDCDTLTVETTVTPHTPKPTCAPLPLHPSLFLVSDDTIAGPLPTHARGSSSSSHHSAGTSSNEVSPMKHQPLSGRRGASGISTVGGRGRPAHRRIQRSDSTVSHQSHNGLSSQSIDELLFEASAASFQSLRDAPTPVSSSSSATAATAPIADGVMERLSPSVSAEAFIPPRRCGGSTNAVIHDPVFVEKVSKSAAMVSGTCTPMAFSPRQHTGSSPPSPVPVLVRQYSSTYSLLHGRGASPSSRPVASTYSTAHRQGQYQQ